MTNPDIDLAAAELLSAIRGLNDTERATLETYAIRGANTFALEDKHRVSDVFHRLGVLAAEDGDRRRDLGEHARRELDGDEMGALVTDLDDLNEHGR